MSFDYENVKKVSFFQENRLEAHSDHISYADREEATLGESSFRYSLNGLWKFQYARNYAQAPKDFQAPDVDCRSWEDIRVPAHIQMEGYDGPQYSNVAYPWDGREAIVPGQIPEHFNPVACYVKYFELPETMKEGPVIISFQGVESALALWCNGEYVGYSEDSFTPSEFDLTDLVKREGENKLAAYVFKWSSGSWCEDQDFFRFSGIFRDVFLYTVPGIHISDLRVQTILDDSYRNAELLLDFKATGAGKVSVKLLKENRLYSYSSEEPET